MGTKAALRSEQGLPAGSQSLPEGVEVRSGGIRVTFHYQGRRCRETLKIPATAANIKYAARLRAEVINQIERQTFDYAASFPNSREAKRQSSTSAPVIVEPLLREFLKQAASLKTLSPSSIRSKSNWAEARIIPRWGKHDARDITVPLLRRWVADELAPELAPVSIRNCLSTLSVALTQAVSDGRLLTNPMRDMDLRTIIPRARAGDTDNNIDPFNDTEIGAILGAARSEDERRLWVFAFASGLRPGELIALRWEHVNIEQGFVLIKDSVVTGLEGAVQKGTKTNLERVIPLLPAAKESLREVAQRKGHVFRSPEGERWPDSATLRRAWKETLQACKVRYRRPYQTRHTFASKLLEQGESITLVASLLGHTTTAMVIKHYGRYIKQRTVPALSGNYESFATAPPVPQTQ